MTFTTGQKPWNKGLKTGPQPHPKAKGRKAWNKGIAVPKERHLIATECPRCGKITESYPSQKHIYCSLSCRSLANARPIPAPERFWSKVDKGTQPDSCWLWTGSLSSTGYGDFQAGGSIGHVSAHSWSFVESNGPLADGFEIAHICDVRYAPSDLSYRRCVRPDHLMQQSHAENVQHMWDSGRR